MKDKKIIKKEELIKLTEEFCSKYLDEEYKELCKKIIEKMARKREVPFLSGKLTIWAASIIHALGQTNFLYDKSFEPFIKYDTLTEHFKTSKRTVTSKAKVIRDMFKMHPFCEEFTTENIMEQNPVENMMKMFEEAFGIQISPEELMDMENEEKFFPGEIPEDDFFTEEEMEFIEEELNEAMSTAYEWGVKFSESPFYENLTEFEKEESENIIMTFTEFMHTYQAETPEEWEDKGIVECCTLQLPQFVIGDKKFFGAITPVLTNFFTFLGEEKLIKNTDRLIDRLKKSEQKIIKAGSDPAFWHAGKTLVMKAIDAGVNIEDETELTEFITRNKGKEREIFLEEKLIKKMETFLPITAYPKNTLVELLKKQGLKISSATPLKIEKIFPSGDTGGIVCSIRPEEKSDEVLALSLTHLNIIEGHPLSEMIREYQDIRTENISSVGPKDKKKNKKKKDKKKDKKKSNKKKNKKK